MYNVILKTVVYNFSKMQNIMNMFMLILYNSGSYILIMNNIN